MKKINIFLRVTATILLLAGCVSAASDDLVYLKVDNVTTSSFDDTSDWAPPPEAGATIDGNLITRWSSDYTDNQWIRFDFGRPKVLSKIIIFWEAAFAIDYDILVSLDNENWQTILSLKDQDGDIDELEFSPVRLRFVKLIGKKRFNPAWGISIWEFISLGPSGENPQDKSLMGVYPKLTQQLIRKLTTQVKLKIEKPVASPGALSLEEFQKGVVYTSWGRTELATEASDFNLQQLKELGVRHLAIMILLVQDTIKENIIYCDPKDTPDDRAIIHTINKAHSLGMKVMLKPHVDIKTGNWRGNIVASEEWFASYKNYIIHYAQLAKEYNVEFFSIGTELANTTTANWQGEWEGIIKEVREVFPGRLIYSANWDEYKTVGFWDKLDFIGIDAYFPLTKKKDPAREELIAAWDENALAIDKWLKEKELNKPVVFAEIGYCSADGTNSQPWVAFAEISVGTIDQQEQADCLEAMLAVCSAYPWFKGFYWWNYFPQDRWSPLGYTIRGKEAEEVFSEWLKRL